MRAARLALLTLVAVLVPSASAPAIIGGQVTTKPWPHMTAIEFASEDLLGNRDFSFGCGGSLVRPDVVLTAAHCVSRDDDGGPDTLAASDVRLQFPPIRPDGTRRRSDGGERILATQVLEHPAYDDSAEGGSDVALIKLAGPAATARTIRLAGPADAASFAPGREATVIGWGAQVFQGPPENTLREARVPIVGDDDCESFSTSELDRPTQLCAGNLQGLEDSCQGDSGGPLMVQDGGGAWILAGVVSQGVGCGTPTQYGIYAEVGGEPLRSWVEANASALSTADDAPPAPTTASGDTGSGAPAPTQTSAASSAPITGIVPVGSATRRGAALRLPSSLGSVRGARRRGGFLLRMRFNAPVTLTATLRQRGKVVARGVRRNQRAGTLRMRLRRGAGVRRGRAVLSVVAVDARGRRYAASRRVTLTR
jgi:secreted trypsin-like serine protease